MPKQTAPIVNFSYANDIKCAGKINFTAIANSSTSYLWNFGDGNTSTLKDVSHVYSSDGIFNVNFKAFNSNGVAEITKSVIVNTNLVHNSNVSSGEYGAVSRIESNQNLPSNVSYQAGKSITLNPGFTSQTGNTFKAEIRNCN